ncbi:MULTISPECIES: site-specific integrase [Microbacterium]|uniref:tyrosine-type recombinase/integrase n=1 Tax=Microbacterium TaxID=33882 RepID=UPI0028E8D04C|nr:MULTISPECIES: site-specific integrase [Microbacterium]
MSSTKVWIADRWKGAKTGTGLRWRVVWIDPDTKRERSQSFKKKPEAEAHQTFLENALRENSYTSPEVAALTVADAVEAWMRSKKNPGEASRGTYRARIDNYVLPRWGNTRLSAVKRTDVDSWVSGLQDGSAVRREGMEGSRGPLAPRTTKAVLVPFIAALRFAVQEGWIRRNPASGVETPRTETEPVIFLGYTELERLIEAMRETATAQDALLVGVMGNIGLRPGEAFALDVGDVNLTRRRLAISKTWTVNGSGKPIIGTSPKTSSGNREVPIPPHLVDDLVAQIGKRPKTAPLFVNREGKHESPGNWRNRQWKRATEAAKTPPGLTPKGLRHTAASLAIAAGADVLMVQRMLGHADAKETLNTYAKIFPDRMDQVTEKMTKARDRALRKRKKKASPEPS